MPTLRCFCALYLLAATSLAGCGSGSSRPEYAAATGDAPLPAPPASNAADPAAVGAMGLVTTDAGLSRKIIYTANVDLRVENFSETPARVVELVKSHEAFVSNSELTGATGTSRHGHWTIRVPVARFESFLEAAKGLGELVSAGVQSQDVSEEYFDVEARIRNKTKEEERLIELLEERPGELKDVLTIERELSRVREEAERMQGRMRVLVDRTTLTTVHLVVQEFRKYMPEKAPNFRTQAARSFHASLRDVRSAGEALAVGLAGLAPWLPIWAVGLGGAFWIARRAWRKMSATTTAPTTNPPDEPNRS